MIQLSAAKEELIRSSFPQEWSSKTDIPSPMTLTPHLRDQMLQMVCEDVAKASHGERTYKNSMVAFRLLAIALQDVEAILLALGEAEEVQDSLNVSMARQRWLTETKSLLREALETIREFGCPCGIRWQLSTNSHHLQPMKEAISQKSPSSSGILKASNPSSISKVERSWLACQQLAGGLALSRVRKRNCRYEER